MGVQIRLKREAPAPFINRCRSLTFLDSGYAIIAEQYNSVLNVNAINVQNGYWVNLPIVYVLHAR